MNNGHSHWLRRILAAYHRVPRDLVTPSLRAQRRTNDADPPPAGNEPAPRDDFEETRPLVFPLH